MLQALARALYSRCSILVFDDLLGALDRKTKHAIIERLFGPDGHVERHGLTVILATHTSRFRSLVWFIQIADSL
jgi:ATP-binding cassette subfamily C (CFTR/MRP) protein 1